jgi:hypothetical protein
VIFGLWIMGRDRTGMSIIAFYEEARSVSFPPFLSILEIGVYFS